MEKLKMHTQDVAEANIEKIGQLFPNCLTERINENGKPEMAIDFDKLKQELSKEVVEGNQERYQFTWPGKREAMRLANTPTNMTLRPNRESSVDFDNTENLYIEGDNLEVLKLLRENYLGKVKMIYIDPPYNTGNDFVYEDDFSETVGTFKDKSGMFDESGNMLLDKYSVNSESNGRFHTDWLNMMYPRLKVAKDILSSDGLIFISIDDNEVHNMRRICDEIFGENHFVSEFIWEKTFRPSNFTRTTRKNSEYIICYSKENIELQGEYEDSQGDFSLTKKKHNPQILHFPKNYVKAFFPDGVYGAKDYENGYELLDDISVKNGIVINDFRVKVSMSIWGQSHLDEEIEKGVTLMFKNPKTMVVSVRKSYQKSELKPTTIIPHEKAGDVLEGNKEINQILGPEIFDYPKPTSLIKHLISIVQENQDMTILDFFSGSATTAHAVMSINSEDGGNRKFILVQLSEAVPNESAAKNAGYRTICEIGEDRIRKAAIKLTEECAQNKNPDNLFNEQSTHHCLDTGFRVLKLDTSNMQDVYYKPEDFSENTLFEDNVKPGRTSEDLLFQVMLECNLPLSAKIDRKTIAGKEVFNVNEGYLLACFDEDVNETVITEVAKLKPYYFIMRDKSLSSDNVADNFEQIFNAYSKDTIRKIL